MEKDIFITLKYYNHGFHTHNDRKTNKIYDAKVAELKDKILQDNKNARNILVEELKLIGAAQKISYLGGDTEMKKCNAEWKAADNIMSALKDTKTI